jgi:hypothetical protein
MTDNNPKPNKDADTSRALVTEEFNRRAWEIGVQYSLNSEDIRAAYADKPESLTTAFNTMSDSKNRRNWNIGWTVAAVVLFWPAAPIPAYFAYKRHQEVEEVGKQVGYEVDRFNAAKKQPPANPGLT